VRWEFTHDSQEEDLLAVVEEEADRLNGMVDETIDLARIETGEIHIHLSRLPVADVINRSLERMASRLDAHRSDVHLPAGIPDISADANLAGLVLKQLIDNAIKYSPVGSKIGISASESNGFIKITVSDEGPGIAHNESEAIFERYYRGYAAQDSVPGTGMGLSIARDIIVAHGGRIWAENGPEKGAWFSFTLPIADQR
jgi:two-component system sensor histidine kinase KdpD